MAKKSLFLLSILSVFITWVLISFGATVRLYGAGLACPDWPLCYGTFTPTPTLQIVLEVGHRYLASFLGLLIMLTYFLCYQSELRNHRKLAGWLFFLVVWQGLIGGLTVLLKLNFSTVILHLLLGNLLFFGLVYFLYDFILTPKASIKSLLQEPVKIYTQIKWLVCLYFLMLFTGGLNSSNYAGYACSAFPFCSPESSFSFFFERETGQFFWNSFLGWNFSLELLEVIHLAHRIVVILGSIILISFAIKKFITRTGIWVYCGYGLIILILGEIAVGISNAVFFVPIPISILHTTLASSITGVLAILLVQAKFSEQ